jgi:hypothetical protein
MNEKFLTCMPMERYILAKRHPVKIAPCIKQSLIDLVVIDAELGKEDHDLIPVTAIGRGLKPLDARTDPRTRLNWW